MVLAPGIRVQGQGPRITRVFSGQPLCGFPVNYSLVNGCTQGAKVKIPTPLFLFSES